MNLKLKDFEVGQTIYVANTMIMEVHKYEIKYLANKNELIVAKEWDYINEIWKLREVVIAVDGIHFDNEEEAFKEVWQTSTKWAAIWNKKYSKYGDVTHVTRSNLDHEIRTQNKRNLRLKGE
jgi:hypothetical protein